MNIEYLIIIFVVLLPVSFASGWFLSYRIGKNKINNAEECAKKIISDAEHEAANLKKEKLLEVKEEWYKKKQEFDHEMHQKRSKLQTYERQLTAREENLEKRVELLNKKDREIQQLKKEIDERLKDIEQKQIQMQRLIQEENQRLEKISGMSRDEAKGILMQNMLNEAKNEVAPMIKEIRDNAKMEAKQEAQKIIIQAIQRVASEYCAESTVSVLNLESDEIKGRIIGKEGRNIRALEAITGVDIIVDDTPEAVILSAYDPLRREIARSALEKLVSDGRIHPARIEEIVAKVQKDIDEDIYRAGENALLECGLHNAQPEIIRHLGLMKYRSSYGQNLLSHSIEVAHLTGIMAAELRLDVSLAKRSGLLHDIGKTLDKNVEGPHALIGYELVKKYGEHPIVVNAVGSHHEDIPMENPIAALVQVADAISGARPGARRESVENYAKRLERLEKLAKSFDGVAKTYAIQAGREIRVIVEPDKVDDAMAEMLANDIASKIKAEMEFPGQIKVTVIREMRAVAYAK